uniref:Ig-like domain-containing protein n=1 Tax=Strongyloides venezuelensis TaxID=75913 RepID=A0A0K0FC29_STRVS
MNDSPPNRPIKKNTIFKEFEICESLTEEPFSDFSNRKSNLNFVVTKNNECFIECEVMSSPKPLINWYKNDELYKSYLNNYMDHTDDLINSKNFKSQMGWSSILSKIEINPDNVGDKFYCEVINPCMNDRIISQAYTVPQNASNFCTKNYKNKRFLSPSRLSNMFGIRNYFNVYKPKKVEVPVITAATTMRMEYPGNLITLSCQSEAYPQATNKWELIEGDDEDGVGLPIENVGYLKVLNNGDLFFNTSQIPEDVAGMTFRCNASNSGGWESFLSTILFVAE